MKKDIYAMLNNADVSIEQYDREELSSEEADRIKKMMRTSSLRKKRKLPLAAAVIAAGIVIAVLYTGSMQGAEAFTRISSSISSFLGIERNLDDYKTVVNKSVTDKGITVKLNEVVLDGDELTVSYNITSAKKLLENESWGADNDILVNGKSVSDASSGAARNVDEYTTLSVMTYHIGNVDLDKELDIDIMCPYLRLNDDEKSGNWNFSFKTSGKKLCIDTKEVQLNYSFSLNNGEDWKLIKYTDNALGQKIFGSITNKVSDKAYDVMLKGTDNFGSKVEFYMSRKFGKDALFKVDRITGSPKEAVKYIKLVPYAVSMPEKSGKLDDNFVKVGDEFTIDLAKLK